MEQADKSIESIYKSALSANGTPLINSRQLGQLADLAHEKTALIDILEVFRLSAGLEIPCIQYGIFSGELDDLTKDLDWSQKVEFQISEVKRTISELAEDGADYGFNVWLIENSSLS